MKFRSLFLSIALLLVFGAQNAHAGAPIIDANQVLDVQNVYGKAQEAGDPFASHSLYGKLNGQPALDVYSFKPSHDGQQTLTLLLPQNEVAGRALVLLLVDPTKETAEAPISLPLPSSDYHIGLIKQSEAPAPSFTDRALLQRYSVQAQQAINFQKDKTYYVIVGEQSGLTSRYVIKFGDGQSWKFSDILRSPRTWFALQFDAYGGTTPFHYNVQALGYTILFLGLALLIGMFLVQEMFSILANRSKSAGYLLVQLQPFSRVAIWVALLLTLIGGATAYWKIGLVGVPFALLLLFIVFTISLLVQTLRLSPQVAKLEVVKREATIPSSLRKRWFAASLITFLSLLAFVVLLSVAILPAV
jgi:hypothetical protein